MFAKRTYRAEKDTLVSEDGSTLVELMVAMALLLAVAFPAGMFLGYMANYPMNKEKIEAYGMAQSALEEMLQSQYVTELTKTEQVRRGWSLERKRSIREGWVYLKVAVYRKDEVVISLSTARLTDNDNDDE